MKRSWSSSLLWVLVLASAFETWHGWTEVKVGGGGQTVIENIHQVSEADLDKVHDNGTASVTPKNESILSSDAEYEELYSDASKDGDELNEDQIDAIFNRTEEKRKIREEELKEEKKKEEQLQEEIRNEKEESLPSLIKSAHITEDTSMVEFAKKLEKINNEEHGPAMQIHLDPKLLKKIPKGMTLKNFENYVEEEEEYEEMEIEEKELKHPHDNTKFDDYDDDDDDDLLYEEPDVTPFPKDTKLREFKIMDVYENFTQDEDTGKAEVEIEDFIHDKSLNETKFLKEKGLFGREKEFNETGSEE